jgi:hypothetical protein
LAAVAFVGFDLKEKHPVIWSGYHLSLTCNLVSAFAMGTAMLENHVFAFGQGAWISRPGLYDTTRYDYGFGGGLLWVICVQHTMFSASVALVRCFPGRERWNCIGEYREELFDLVSESVYLLVRNAIWSLTI